MRRSHASRTPRREAWAPVLTTLCVVLALGAACAPERAPTATPTAQAPTPHASTGAPKTTNAPAPGAGRAPTFAPTPPARPRAAQPEGPERAKIAPSTADLERFTRGIPGAGTLWATLHTSAGTISCALHEDEAPVAVASFVGLARGLKAWVHPGTAQPQTGEPLYDGTVFHRAVAGFVIQGGDPLGNGKGRPGYAFASEPSSRRFDRAGVLAMAHAGPNTNGSQFFITLNALPHLDTASHSHTIFGQCEGLAVARDIAARPKDTSVPSYEPPPKDPVTLRTVTFERRSARRAGGAPQRAADATHPAPQR